MEKNDDEDLYAEDLDEINEFFSDIVEGIDDPRISANWNLVPKGASMSICESK